MAETVDSNKLRNLGQMTMDEARAEIERMQRSRDAEAELVEARAEIERLRRQLDTAIEVNGKLHDELAKYEAAEALAKGTIEQPWIVPIDTATSFTWDVPPNAPPHDQQQPTANRQLTDKTDKTDS